jgi:REP element-mobilizing transposase RayT
MTPSKAPRRARRWKQRELDSLRHGGRREKAGRKKGRRVSRTARPALSRHHPVHCTLRVRDDAPRLRRVNAWAVLRAVFRRGKDRFGFRLVHFSVQTNHLHLLCEAEDKRSLARGMQGLAIRVARHMNRLAGRRGKLFADRYHAEILGSPTRVRRALVYVLHNGAHHNPELAGAIDVYSSAPYFNGWRRRIRLRFVDDGPPPVVPARTWLLTTGWLRAGGPIDHDEVPAPSAGKAA